MSHFHFADTCHVSLSHNAAVSERASESAARRPVSAARHQLQRSNRREGGREEGKNTPVDGSGLNTHH